jgi:hypothetical protein
MWADFFQWKNLFGFRLTAFFALEGRRQSFPTVLSPFSGWRHASQHLEMSGRIRVLKQGTEG